MSSPVKTVVASNAARSSPMMAGCMLCRLPRFGVLDRAPDPFRRQWHVDLRDAVFRQRIERRIDDADETAGAAGLAAPLGAERVGFGRRGMVAGSHQGNVARARHRIIH